MRSLPILFGLAYLFGLVSAYEIRSDFIEKIIQDARKQNLVAKDMVAYESMTTPEIIQSFGYPVEIHHVVTEDNYILELHRIPYGLDGPTGGVRPVAFMEHGLLMSSFDFVADLPDRALAYLLAEAGYDVWMNNKRGNTYSRNHTSLDPDVDQKEFWDFTWDEMAVSDVPAALDYALATTGNTQVYYIGFSMGTTVFFALMSEKHEYADKIKVAALMGPVTYLQHVKGAIRVLANYSDDLDLVLSLLGYYEFLPSDEVMDNLAQQFCNENDTTAVICYNILFLIGGFDPEELNEPNVPILLSHTPAGTSTHTVNHYGQLVNIGIFEKYNWGRVGNQDHYGTDDPPDYNLGVDMPPIGLYWGPNDWLATPEDVARLASEINNVVVNHRVERDEFTHLDFTWAIHAKELVYDYVLGFLSRY